MGETNYEDYEADDPWDCYQCGGEGFVWSCFDGFCVDAEEGCDDCTRPCPECARRTRDNQPTPDAQALSDVLAEALNKTQNDNRSPQDMLGKDSVQP